MTINGPVLRGQGSGLFFSMAGFALSQAAGLSLVPMMCTTHLKWPLLVTLAAFVLAASGGLRSWRFLAACGIPSEICSGDNAKFLAVVSVGVSILLALAIVLQGAAVLIFSGCER
jgi:hypothetical protein